MRVNLWLRIGRHGKFVMGIAHARQKIEKYILSKYNLIKRNSWEYQLAIPYETEEDLGATIANIYAEMDHTADLYNCFIEADINAVNGEKSW